MDFEIGTSDQKWRETERRFKQLESGFQTRLGVGMAIIMAANVVIKYLHT